MAGNVASRSELNPNDVRKAFDAIVQPLTQESNSGCTKLEDTVTERIPPPHVPSPPMADNWRPSCFLRCTVRRKDDKHHSYWSVVQNTRVGGGRVVQQRVRSTWVVIEASASSPSRRSSGNTDNVCGRAAPSSKTSIDRRRANSCGALH
jgi:hypothetical protein